MTAPKGDLDLFGVIPSITSGVALAAFFAAVVAYVLVSRTRREQGLIDALPEKDRLKALRELADDLGISAKSIQDEERVAQLVMARLQQRAASQRWLFLLIFGIAVLATGLAAFQIARDGQRATPAAPATTASAASTDRATTPAAPSAPTAAASAAPAPGNSGAPRTTPANARPRPTTASDVAVPAAPARPAPAEKLPVAEYSPSRGEARPAPPTATLLLGTKVRVVYSAESAERAERVMRGLRDAGAFVDGERWLPEQLDAPSTLRHSSTAQRQAEAARQLLTQELGPLPTGLLAVNGQHDLEIRIARP